MQTVRVRGASLSDQTLLHCAVQQAAASAPACMPSQTLSSLTPVAQLLLTCSPWWPAAAPGARPSRPRWPSQTPQSRAGRRSAPRGPAASSSAGRGRAPARRRSEGQVGAKLVRKKKPRLVLTCIAALLLPRLAIPAMHAVPEAAAMHRTLTICPGSSSSGGSRQ